MTGENVKAARKFIRRAKLYQDIYTRLHVLYLYIEEQAHRLDGDHTCIACGKWITDVEKCTYCLEDGYLCRRCSK